jgi:hypothetical protein
MTSIIQEGNSAGGNIVGHDYNQITNIESDPSNRCMRELIQQLRSQANDPEKRFYEKLLKWYKKAEGDVLGLEEKLKRGGYSSDINLASELKQTFAKTIIKTEYQPISQEIIARTLAKIRTEFHLRVNPIIDRNGQQEEVKREISQIISEIESYLDTNPLLIDCDEIYGMIYWLTGNCYINWTNANIQSSI